MTARTLTQLRGAGLIAMAVAAAAAIAIALASLAVPAHAGSPGLAHADPGPPQLVVIQEADTAATARRIGWPVGVLAIVTLSALALGAAGQRSQRRGRLNLGRLAQGTAATSTGAGAAIGAAVLDTLLAGGSPAAVGVAITATILAFWRARRPAPAPGEVDDARTRRHQRGSAAAPLLPILGCAAIAAGALAAWSCTGAQRLESGAVAVDCTIGALAENADAIRPVVGAAIRAGDWDAVRAAAMGVLRDAVGCAAVAVVIEIERPPGVVTQALTADGAPPAPDPAATRAAWERLRREHLGGRTYKARAGSL